MSKFFKRIAVLVSLFCLAIAVGIFAACKDDKPDNTVRTRTYTITITAGGTPVSGMPVEFRLVDEDGNDLTEKNEFTTDADGKLTAVLPRDNSYRVTLKGALPAGYALPAANKDGWYLGKIYGNTNNYEFTLVSVSNNVTYTFSVEYEDKTPAAGVTVTYSETENGGQRQLGTTNEEGKLILSCEPLKGYASVSEPNGYVYDRDPDPNNKDENRYALKSEGNSVSFTLIPHYELNANGKTPMTSEEKNEFSSSLGTLTTRAAYAYSVTAEAGKTVFLSYVTEETDNYYVFVQGNFSNLKVLNNSNTNTNQKNVLATLTAKGMGQGFPGVQNVRQYFAVTADSRGGELTVVIAEPPQRNELTVTDVIDDQGKTYQGTVYRENPFYFIFKPDKEGQGLYEINVSEGFELSYLANKYATPAEGSFTTREEVNITESELKYSHDGSASNQTWVFYVRMVDRNAEEGAVTVSLVRKGDAVTRATTQYNFVQVTESLSAYPNNAKGEELKQVGVTIGANERIFKGTDGFYHLNAINGPIVLVRLKGTVPVYYTDSSTPFEQLDKNGDRAFFHLINLQETLNDPTVAYKYDVYTRFLRGYHSAEDAPEDRFDEYYLKYVNSDGVYPLNDELMAFLKAFAETKRVDLISYTPGASDMTKDQLALLEKSLWLFSACYYDNGFLPAPAPTVGEGTANNPYLLQSGKYTVSLTGSATYFIYESASEGTITFDAANITVLCNGQTVVSGGKVSGTFTMQASSEVSFEIELTPPAGSSSEYPAVLSVGSGTLENGLWYRFTASEEGVYSLTANEHFTLLAVNGENLFANNLVLRAGDSILFRFDNPSQNGVTAELAKSSAEFKTAGANGAITEVGAYRTEITGGASVVYKLTAAGSYALSSSDSKIQITYNEYLYEGGSYLTIKVGSEPVEIEISAIRGYNGFVYFFLENRPGTEEENPISITLDANDGYAETVTIGASMSPNGSTVADVLYYTFTAPKSGYYLFSLGSEHGEISPLIGGVYTGDLSWNNVTGKVEYGKQFAQGETLKFSLSASKQASCVFAVSLSNPPAEGSYRAPKTAAAGNTQITLKTGEYYYFEIGAGQSYSFTIANADGLTMYNFGGNPGNTEYLVESRIVANGATVSGEANGVAMKIYLVIAASKDVTATVTCAQSNA